MNIYLTRDKFFGSEDKDITGGCDYILAWKEKPFYEDGEWFANNIVDILDRYVSDKVLFCLSVPNFIKSFGFFLEYGEIRKQQLLCLNKDF